MSVGNEEKFELYDLEIAVVGDPQTFVCGHQLGTNLIVKGEDLRTEQPNGFSLYALAALLPLIPAKQRMTDENDWMSSDELIACPDPLCGAQFKISRGARRTFNRAAVTKTQKKQNGGENA